MRTKKEGILERKLRVIKEIMGETTIIGVGVRKTGEIDIISADNVGLNPEDIEETKTLKGQCEYIG